MKRQKIRKFLLLLTMLLFPIIMWYLSPYLIIAGAMNGIMTGSFIVFVAMFISSMFLGRFFCGYICPAGGLQECAMMVNDKSPKQGWKNYIKYIIWVIWIAAIVLGFLKSGKVPTPDFFFLTTHGISIGEISDFIVYYLVIIILFIPPVLFGKRVVCHYFCWMAPFMVLGSKLGKALHLPQLHIDTDASKCVSCKQCNVKCPMSIDVEKSVHCGKGCGSECILCGSCVDNCPKKAVRYRFSWKKK